MTAGREVSETVVLSFTGGPADGERRMMNVEWFGWPPPQRVGFPDTPGGYYQRTRYSQLPLGLPHVMRGAEYEWVAA